ncbi:uncharacterized protein LOC127632976 [Xyrauchen texanus]|uniref:uncharacterized protein LOC127632976 n=1 Tax=Xyrauchen texanus TaxID=154827 RepID=UPI002242961D|nr:uncharacterized protein LOC127632976 [Xyrauchen texanus]
MPSASPGTSYPTAPPWSSDPPAPPRSSKPPALPQYSKPPAPPWPFESSATLRAPSPSSCSVSCPSLVAASQITGSSPSGFPRIHPCLDQMTSSLRHEGLDLRGELDKALLRAFTNDQCHTSGQHVFTAIESKQSTDMQSGHETECSVKCWMEQKSYKDV